MYNRAYNFANGEDEKSLFGQVRWKIRWAKYLTINREKKKGIKSKITLTEQYLSWPMEV